MERFEVARRLGDKEVCKAGSALFSTGARTGKLGVATLFCYLILITCIDDGT